MKGVVTSGRRHRSDQRFLVPKLDDTPVEHRRVRVRHALRVAGAPVSAATCPGEDGADGIDGAR